MLGLVKDVQTKSGKLYKEWLKCVASPCLTIPYILFGQTLLMKECDVSFASHWQARSELLLTYHKRLCQADAMQVWSRGTVIRCHASMGFTSESAFYGAQGG